MSRFRNASCRAVFVIGALMWGAGAHSVDGPYRVEPSTVANGGGRLAGGAFQLSGTIGQAQTSTLSGSGYRFYGGFWAPASDAIFANGFDK